jgi:Mg-chelatase subunit ChlI
VTRKLSRCLCTFFCGTIDIEKALTEGIKAFEPGLLAKANRGLLYVDEVNLLDDHLVDIYLILQLQVGIL